MTRFDLFVIVATTAVVTYVIVNRVVFAAVKMIGLDFVKVHNDLTQMLGQLNALEFRLNNGEARVQQRKDEP